ncbi:MAG: hypothetical protein KatS3mg115_2295 [Candidatus Poribacteria bacterium]|nr:MAG: hypothetical protein KatS3mg115_2295 [Candidatus Poribacteria bacterium]
MRGWLLGVRIGLLLGALWTAGAWDWTSTGGPLGGFVFSLLVASNGWVYAGTHDGGLYRSSDGGERWELANAGLPRGDVLSLVGRGSVLYAAVDGFGVYRSQNRAEEWRSLGAARGLETVVALAWWEEGLYAATAGAGVYRYRSGAWEPLSEGLTTPLVLGLFADQSGLYAGLWGAGLVRWSGSRWEQAGLVVGSPIALGRVGQMLLVGTHEGRVFRSVNDGRSWDRIPELEGQVVWAIASRGEIAFLATEGGSVYLSRGAELPWRPVVIGRRAVRALSEGPGGLFAGTDGHGVFRWEGDAFRQKGLPNSFPMSLARFQGETFAGTAFNGVLRFCPGAGRWEPLWEGLPEGAVWALVPWRDRLLAAVEGYGVFAWEGAGPWRPFGLEDRNIRAFCVFDGALWAGTEDGGVFRWDGAEGWEPVSAGLPPEAVTALGAGDGLLLAGTAGRGVFRWAPDRRRWEPLPFPSGPSHLLALLPWNGAVYAAGAAQLYRLTTGSVELNKWEPLGLGPVWALVPWNDRLLAGTRTGGLFLADESGRYWEPVGPEDGWVRTVQVDETGTVWVGLWGEGVFLGKTTP